MGRREAGTERKRIERDRIESRGSYLGEGLLTHMYRADD